MRTHERTHGHTCTDRQTDIQTDRQTDRQTGMQTGRQTDKQADRQTDRQTHKHTHMHVCPQTQKFKDRYNDFSPTPPPPPYTQRTNGALKDLIGSFTLSQIQDPIRCFRGPLSRVPRSTTKVLQSTPHKVRGSTPIVALGHPVLTFRRIIAIYIMTCGSYTGHLYMSFTTRGSFEGPYTDWRYLMCNCGVYLWCHRCIMLSKQTN